jgi:hypothetical protein
MKVVQAKLVKLLTFAETDRTRRAEMLFPCERIVPCRFQVNVIYDAAADGFHDVSVMFSVTGTLPVFLT